MPNAQEMHKMQIKRCLLGVGLLILSANAYSQKVSNAGEFGFRDLQKPEQVLAYMKTVLKEGREKAETYYRDAQKEAETLETESENRLRVPDSYYTTKSGVSWNSVAKNSGKSIFAYPTGKAFFLFIEAELKNGVVIARDIRTSSLWDASVENLVTKAIDWFDTAIAIEAYEQSLDEAQRSKLVSYRDCLKRYRETGEAEPDCIPLQWATGGEADLLRYMELVKKNQSYMKQYRNPEQPLKNLERKDKP
jgi:hypothetical protein